MKTIFSLAMLALLTAILFSCKTSDEIYVSDPSGALIRTQTFLDTNGVYKGSVTNQYDSINRLYKMVWDNGPNSSLPVSTSVFEYRTGKITQTASYPSQPLAYRIIYYQNSAGLADSSVTYYFNASGDTTAVRVMRFTYDEQGYMTKMVTQTLSHPTVDEIRTWTITGGNVASMTITESGTGTPITENYEYYASSINCTGNKNMGMPWMGKSSVNLVKTASYFSDPKLTATCSYWFDNYMRVTIQLITGRAYTYGPHTVKYTYD